MYNRKDILRICFFIVLPINFAFTDFIFKDDILGQTERRISEIKATTKPSEELIGFEAEELAPYIAYHFNEGAEDPFAVKSFVQEINNESSFGAIDQCKQDDCGDGPPAPHTPFFLESYNMDQLSMVGTLDDPKKGRIALVQTPDSGVVYSSTGEYIGRNNGLILSISREKMIIREKYRSPQGWKDRMATLNLIRN